MSKIVVLRLNYKLSEARYEAVAEIDNGVEIHGWLPALSGTFLRMLEDWKVAFSSLDFAKRLKVKKISTSKVASPHFSQLAITPTEHNISWNKNCEDLAVKLSNELNKWLNSQHFFQIKEKIWQQLKFNENLQVIICTDDLLICRLPWHCWELLTNNNNAEISFSLADESSSSPSGRQSRHLESLKILVILGDNEGLDLEKDRQILVHQLAERFNVFLKQVWQPSSNDLKKELEIGSWDMLFFSGHSETLNGEGIIYLQGGESVYLTELNSSFSKAMKNGLKLAIFNSCDGIGIAKSIQSLQIPQVIVMREPVPDKVAHDFLLAYIEGIQKLESDSPLYLAEKYARDKIKHSFPCADWLPIIFQNHKIPTPVRGVLERPISKRIIENKRSLEEKIGITPEIQFGENINCNKCNKKEFKVTVIDPADEQVVGKIRYMGGLWKARVFPLAGCDKLEPIFPGDEVCVVAREGATYLVLPMNLAHSDLFKKSRDQVKSSLSTKQRKIQEVSGLKQYSLVVFGLVFLMVLSYVNPNLLGSNSSHGDALGNPPSSQRSNLHEASQSQE